MRAALVIALITLACEVGYAQSTETLPAFDAVSVKVAPPPDGGGSARRVEMSGGPGTKTPGRINFENVGLGFIIGKAYGVKHYQIAGPEWFASRRFNVIATVPAGTTEAQFRLMLQNLLSDRFKLKLHRETRQLDIYSLAIAKNGPKLKKAAPDPPPDPNDTGGGKLTKDSDGYPALRPGMTMAIVDDRARLANREHMPWLVDMLASQTGRPVVDATGLTEKYDFLLSWIPRMAGTDPAIVEDPAGPDIFAALQQQLGLKLEPKKGPIEVLVVDRVEKTPTEN